MQAWPHQLKCVESVREAVAGGLCRIAVTAPTGSGKSWIMAALAKQSLDAGDRVILLTNRRMLLEQSSRVFAGFDLDHGVIAAGVENEGYKKFQIASIQTIVSRMKNKDDYQLPEAKLVLVDEIHVNAADTMQDLMALYVERGAVVVMFTATPIDIGHVADTLIVACNNSEGRACGALVKAVHFGIDEPDCRKLKVPLGADLSENVIRKIMGAPRIVGRVIENYRRLNPDQKPTILFASGVSESLFFAEQFCKAGIPFGHIDGDNIGFGELDEQGRMILYPSSPDARERLKEMVRSGELKGCANRHVLREGIDWPFLCHGILATVFGALGTFLQVVGRLLRAFAGKTHAIIQDHGGAWWRFGSANADREWRLDYTSGMIAAMREDRLRDGAEPEPWRCPECAMILTTRCCPCGFEIDTRRRSRPVMQLDGSLIELDGPIFKPHREYTRPDGPELWRIMVTKRCMKPSGYRTFRAAAALFAWESMKNGGPFAYPQRTWPLMPKRDLDWYREVHLVPGSELT